MNILCTICVRKGSSGLRNKNFLKINNKMLLEYTIEVAIETKIFSQISISSDYIFSEKFKNKYKNIFFYKRPHKLSTAAVGKVKVIRDLYLQTKKNKNIDYDYIIDLDVTSPLRSTKDVIGAFKRIRTTNKSNLITIVEAKKNPYFNMVEIKNDKIKISKKINKKILSRQVAPKVYDMNASIYIWKKNELLKDQKLITKNTDFYIMDKKTSIDIDDKFDFEIVKKILETQ